MSNANAICVCRVEKSCSWRKWSQEGRLIHEFTHYGMNEERARAAVMRLTGLADSLRKRETA